MVRPWDLVDSADTPDGLLKLLRRGEGDFLITLDGRVVMNSRANRSELALAGVACREIAAVPSPRVLLGGLGMGCTLAEALAGLPQAARVIVAELHPVVVAWCGGPLSAVNRDALADPRVEVVIDDVSERIRTQATEPERPGFDAILLDLFEGPHPGTDPVEDPIYGERALERTRRALAPDGVLAVWSEAPDRGFETRLQRSGFRVQRQRPGRGGRRHAVVLASLRRS